MRGPLLHVPGTAAWTYAAGGDGRAGDGDGLPQEEGEPRRDAECRDGACRSSIIGWAKPRVVGSAWNRFHVRPCRDMSWIQARYCTGSAPRRQQRVQVSPMPHDVPEAESARTQGLRTS